MAKESGGRVVKRKLGDMKQMVQIPYELEQEEDGTWGAHASFPSGGAHGIGDTPEQAVADLYEAVSLVIEECRPASGDSLRWFQGRAVLRR